MSAADRSMPLPPSTGRALALLGAALAVFAIPARYEGPVLVPVSPGHAIAVADAIAIVPLAAASLLLYRELWRQRRRAAEYARQRPGPALLTAFAGGAGLGLLFASAFSSWFWWWAVGALLFGGVLTGVSVALSVSGDSPPPGGPSQ